MKKKILVVDDESSARFLLELMLKQDYKVDSAFNTASVLEAVSKTKFDIILMDINLGQTDSGIDALRKIREIEAYRDIPIVAVTAYAMAKDRNNLLSLGFNEYIAKPFERDELLSIIEKVLKTEVSHRDK